MFQCSYTDDGDFDPSGYLALARPRVVVESGSAFALAAESSAGSGSSFTRPFGLLSAGAAPGSAFAFSAMVADGGLALGSPEGGDSVGGLTVADKAASATLVLKTARVYHDETTVEVAYQLFDATGRTAVLATGLVVTLGAVLDTDGSKTESLACGAPNALSGVGGCAFELDGTWFSTVSATTVTLVLTAAYDGADPVVTSAAANMFLQKQPTFAALAGAGMEATLPHHPKIAGDSFTVPVTANTGGHDLSVWVIKFT